MRQKTRLAVLAIAGGAVLLAGCGSGGSGSNNSSAPPANELASAVKALGDTQTLTSTLRLGGTAQDVLKFAAAVQNSLTPAEANAISGIQVAVEVSAPSGKKVSDLGAGNTSGAGVDVSVSANGTDYLSVRVVDKVLYVQADLRDLLNTFGKGATYAQLQASGAQLPSFAQAFIAGRWISLSESAATGLAGGSTSSGSSQQFTAVINALKSILTKDVAVKRTSTGNTDVLELSANSRALVQDFVASVTSALPSAALALGQVQPNTSQVPSRTITLNANVTGGALSQVSIDLGQFDPKDRVKFPLELDFTRGGAAISAPSGAVAINPTDLGQLLASFTGGLGAGLGG